METLTAQGIEHLPRPSKKDITVARNRIKKARKTIVDVEKKHDDYKTEFEGDNSQEFMFNRAKFFRNLGTTCINELAKLYNVYDRRENKQTRIQRLCDLPNADDIIFEEVGTLLYSSVYEMQERLTKKPEKSKRGRPPKKKPTP